jgi:hypothetical protein
MDKPTKKEKLLLVSVHKETSTEALKDMMDNSGVERGLHIGTKMGVELFQHINTMKKRGYFFCGMIVEDGNEVEFLFQRHQKQTKQHLLLELKPEEQTKYTI